MLQRLTIGLLSGVSAVCLLHSDGALAQSAGFQTTDELIVYGTVVTRNRTESTAPVLSYDLEYFQRFEPISAGDALKRVPGVSFSSDLLEYDFMQLRGLPAIYAQVQVNGQQMTGGGNDRVFAVDRIPAELIDSVEVIRSPSADMSVGTDRGRCQHQPEKGRYHSRRLGSRKRLWRRGRRTARGRLRRLRRHHRRHILSVQSRRPAAPQSQVQVRKRVRT